MYCSSCGAGIGRGLSFCNHCGAKLGASDDAKPAATFSESLVWAIVAVFIIGLGCMIGFMAVMKNVVGFDTETILIVTSLIFLLLFVIEAVLIRLLLRQESKAGEAVSAGQDDERAADAIASARERALAEPAQSVTEHTTRRFEPVYSERKAD